MKNFINKTGLFLLLFFVPILSFSKNIETLGYDNFMTHADSMDCQVKLNNYLTKSNYKETNKISAYKFKSKKLNTKNNTKNIATLKKHVFNIFERYRKLGVDLTCQNGCQIIANFINIDLDSLGYYTEKIFIDNANKDLKSKIYGKIWNFHVVSKIEVDNETYVIDFPSSEGNSTFFLMKHNEWLERSFNKDNAVRLTVMTSDELKLKFVNGIAYKTLNTTLREIPDKDIIDFSSEDLLKNKNNLKLPKHVIKPGVIKPVIKNLPN